MTQQKNNTSFIRINDIEVAYTSAGLNDAETILFIHGFPLNKSMWIQQLEFFKRDFRVIAPDIRGHGETDEGKKPYSISLFAHDLIGFMDALQLEKVILCGLSMGGYITLNVAHRYPDRFSALILTDTSCKSDTPEAREKRMQTIMDIEQNGLEKYADESLKRLFAPDSLIYKTDETEAVRKMILSTTTTSIFSSLRALATREESCSKLSGINIPTLVITGQADIITPPEIAEWMHQQIPHSRIHILEEAGHMSNMENPEGFNEQLWMFLSTR
ncbi:MAG TPA: alpha/beta fold hydrolase [Saprospiraceae bacterium]|nr:alpha/beta fold hydrolase [Saprospiraceae bacterium]